nr:2-dehydro-3-deoxygalactonokinase [Aliivibrio fischeri]
MVENNWIAIDWGTTNFRAFLMNEQGECLSRVEESKGLLSVKKGDFPSTLEGLIGHWLTACPTLPILMAGMVGSKQGWKEAQYIKTPASISEFIGNTVTVFNGQANIIAGVSCSHNSVGMSDVMRGEEVQLIGLSDIIKKSTFFSILPGTHSKHVYWKNGLLERFSTVMTGELFSLLKHHSILGKDLPIQHNSQHVFLDGVCLGRQHPLNQILFSVRTRRLFNQIDEHNIESYLSGLLIGHELSQLSITEPCFVVGNSLLTERYVQALNHLGFDAQQVSGDECFLAGMNHLYQSFKGENKSNG